MKNSFLEMDCHSLGDGIGIYHVVLGLADVFFALRQTFDPLVESYLFVFLVCECSSLEWCCLLLIVGQNPLMSGICVYPLAVLHLSVFLVD